MPGRVAAGTRAPRGRAAAGKTTAASTAEVPDEGPDTTLRRAICAVFADAQKSTAAHRKAIISLRKIQEACCYEPTSSKKGKQDQDFDEDEFNNEVLRCVFRALPIKKSEAVGDRIVRFLGAFLETASAKDNAIFQDEEEVPETPSSRLVTAVLSAMIPLMMAKDKVVRFRATQMTSHLINTLSTLDLSLFHQLKLALLKRIHDKEAQVRMHAIYGLTRFAADPENDDEDDNSDSDEDAGSGILEKLILVLQHDPSAEVRRNLLLNLPLTKELLPYLFERARDADVTTRKALFARLLPAMGDFRSFSLTFRDKLLRWGLRDRDENVRKAMARIFRERWIEDCAARPANRKAGDPEDAEPKDPNMANAPSMNALSELLERIDVVNTGGEGGIALLAMQEFWEGRPDYVDYVSFPDEFWGDLTPEVAFVARTFNDFCRSNHKEDRYVGSRSLDILAEEKLPEVTKFGFLLQRELNRLMEAARAAAMEESEESEEELAAREFVVEQMLHMALTFDYSDEVGRRKMDILMRDALAMPDLPEETTRLVVENLRRVCGEDSNGEREFCRLVVEAIAEVHDTIMGEDDDPALDDSSIEGSFHSATSQFDGAGDETLMLAKKRLQRAGKTVESSKESDTEQAIRELMVNLKCLHIALCLLQNIQCDVHQYEHLVMTLNSLIVPAVRSQEAPIRERGLFCLGLCCLVSKKLASENMNLFLHCFTRGHGTLQVIALQCITDVLIAHPSLYLDAPDTSAITSDQTEINETSKLVLKAFSKSLKSGDPIVQAIGAAGLAKAMLSRLITDTDLLKQLVITFFDPDSVSNPQLRQSLSYFLPVYCHSRADNAARMATISCAVIARLTTLRDARLEDDDADAGASAEAMVSISQVANMLLDWTDPRKIVGYTEPVPSADNHATPSSGTTPAVADTHFILAESVLERLVTSQLNRDERKALLNMLGKLYLPAGTCDAELLKTILELLVEAIDSGVATDKTGENILAKLRENLMKLVHDVMTLERGGGSAAGEATEVDGDEDVEDGSAGGSTTGETKGGVSAAGVKAEDDDEEEVEEEDDDDENDVTAQLQREMRDTTIGFTTTAIVPDAEGTRIQLLSAREDEDDEEEDSEMMDVDG